MNILTSIVFVLAVLTVVSRASASPVAHTLMKGAPLNGHVAPLPRDVVSGTSNSNCTRIPSRGQLSCY